MLWRDPRPFVELFDLFHPLSERLPLSPETIYRQSVEDAPALGIVGTGLLHTRGQIASGLRERERGEMQDGADHPVIRQQLETADCRAGFAIAGRDGARLHADALLLCSDLGEREGSGP